MTTERRDLWRHEVDEGPLDEKRIRERERWGWQLAAISGTSVIWKRPTGESIVVHSTTV